MAEKLVPLMKDGQRVEIAVTPADFQRAKMVRKDGAPADASRPEHFESYMDAGYRLSDYYENMEPYDGPKTKAQFTREAEERRAARAEAPKAAESAPAKAEAKKD